MSEHKTQLKLETRTMWMLICTCGEEVRVELNSKYRPDSEPAISQISDSLNWKFEHAEDSWKCPKCRGDYISETIKYLKRIKNDEPPPREKK